MPAPMIIVHGGAGKYSAIRHDKLRKDAIETGVEGATKAGWMELQDSDKTAVDAVQAAVMFMENNPNFNAGIGSSLTSEGTVEMDAIIMDGKTMDVGAVTVIEHVRNPIKVSRDILDKSPHVLLAGQGALDFAMKHGHEKCSADDLIMQGAIARLKKRPEFEGASVKEEFNPQHQDKYVGFADPDEHDTVGAAAVDRHGNVAFASSTGGITAKQPGRIGDSPLVGSGGYADNEIGAICTTGHGESLIRVVAAKHIATLIQSGLGAEEAINQTMAYMLDRIGGRAGAIAVTPSGDMGAGFNTEGMAWAAIKDGENITYGTYPGEKLSRPL